MDVSLTADQQFLRKTIREFAESEIRPHVSAWDEAQAFPADLVPKLAALGLMGIQVPEELGGAGLSAVDYCLCIEELARVCPAVALSAGAHNGLCVAHLLRFGTDAQKRLFVPALARGEHLGAWALTEATSGSDAAMVRTTAVRDGDSWVLNGSKHFITHGRVGHLAIVIAATQREAGVKGLSAFIVPKTLPGVRAGRKENKLGMRASDTSEIVLENCRVPADHRLGDEGHGFLDAMAVLDAGRIGIAALSVGLAQGAFDAAFAYAHGRVAFGKPISSFEAIQFKLADAATHIDAARLMTFRAAAAKDRGEPITLLAAMAKLFASEVAVKVADDGLQIHGGYGFIKDYPAEKYVRDAKLLTIGEGTSEIQRLVIARELERIPH